MPFHKEYADGSPRPLLRGWLHGISACIALPLVYTHWSSLPAPSVPGILAICYTLVLSGLVHLVRWPNDTILELFVRLDKTGILLIGGCTFWGPQLLTSEACKPDFLISLCTVAIPVGLSIVGVACGLGPIVFTGVAVAITQTIWWFGTQVHGASAMWHTVICAILYGSGLALYVSQAGGHRPYWGYHEWMHLLVTIGFLINIRGLLMMSQYTEETCLGIATDEINNLLESAESSAW